MRVIIILVLVVFLPMGALAGLLGPDNPEECVLKYAKETRSTKGVLYIRNACDHPYGLFEGPDDFQQCILDEMPGVENDRAAFFIFSACKKRTQSQIKKTSLGPYEMLKIDMEVREFSARDKEKYYHNSMPKGCVYYIDEGHYRPVYKEFEAHNSFEELHQAYQQCCSAVISLEKKVKGIPEGYYYINPFEKYDCP